MGWSTIEEVIYSDDDHTWIRPRGALFTTGPGTYKLPAFNDVPEVFNVSLLEDADNPFAVHSSKAVGEPPFFLGASVRLDHPEFFFFRAKTPLVSVLIHFVICRFSTQSKMQFTQREKSSLEAILTSRCVCQQPVKESACTRSI